MHQLALEMVLKMTHNVAKEIISAIADKIDRGSRGREKGMYTLQPLSLGGPTNS